MADETLAEAFWAVAHELRRSAKSGFDTIDVTPAQARALMVLARHGAVRQRVLSDHLRIVPRSVTEVVDALEERKLVRRQPDPTDRRATLVDLTAAGKRAVGKIRDLRTADSEAFFAQLSDTDRAHLGRILRKLRTD